MNLTVPAINQFNQETPKVSFCMITYNHEKFVYQALQSIVDSQFDFSFEIIVGNDCSTDNTQNEILRFIDRNPVVSIQCINREKNVGVLDNMMDVYERAKGQYILPLDGDDYLQLTSRVWINKYLVDNTTIIFSHKVFDSINGNEKVMKAVNLNLDQTLDGVFFHFGSVFMPRIIIEKLLSSTWVREFNFLDRYFQIEITRMNKTVIFEDIELSVYRKHENSLSIITSSKDTLLQVTRFIVTYYKHNFHELSSSQRAVFLKRIMANYLLIFHPANLQKYPFYKNFYQEAAFIKNNLSYFFTKKIQAAIIANYFVKVIYTKIFKKNKTVFNSSANIAARAN